MTTVSVEITYVSQFEMEVDTSILEKIDKCDEKAEAELLQAAKGNAGACHVNMNRVIIYDSERQPIIEETM